MSPEQLSALLPALRNGQRDSQKLLYEQFYSVAMSVCIRYARHRQEAEEICNDGFVRIFLKIGDLQHPRAFVSWLRQTMVRAAIDYHRKFHKSEFQAADWEEAVMQASVEAPGLNDISYEEKLKMVQTLPAACRIAFNLYAVEGYSTAEIAHMLQIAEGTVRANVAKARTRLQEMISTAEQIKFN